MALMLYCSGVSMNRTAQIIGVSDVSIMRWMEAWASKLGDLPVMSDGQSIDIELDEMWHFIGQKKISAGYGRHIVVARDAASHTHAVTVVSRASPSS